MKRSYKRKIFKRNIKTKLVLSFIGITILPIVLICMYSYWNLQDSIKQNYYQDSKQAIIGFDSNLTIYFNELEKLTTSIFKSKDIQSILTSEPETELNKLKSYWILDVYLNNLILARPDVSHLKIYSKTDIVYEKNMTSTEKLFDTDQEVIRILEKNNSKFVIYGTRKSDTSTQHPRYYITVGRQIKNLNSGEDIGYVIIDLSYDMINKIFYNKNAKDNMLVVNSNGSIIYDRENKNNITKNYNDIEEYKDHYEGEKEKKYIARIDSEKLGWSYIRITNMNNLFGTINKIAKTLIVMGSSCFLAFLCVAIVISNNISKPLKKLEDTMEKAESNNFNEIALIPNTYDEVNNLTRRFNVMLVEIHRLIENEKEIEKKKAKSDYRALQLQITPHFLYNSLESINCLAQIRGVQDISEMVLSLADIFKYNMRHDVKYVRLEDEIKHVKNYCMLQAVLFQDKFKIIYHLEDKYLECKVLKFMLQPIVENAINHGMKSLKENGRIVISVLDTSEEIIVSVSDNGSGMSQDNEEELNELLSKDINQIYNYNANKSSIGLSNVHLRLKLSFGEKAGLSIITKENEGTTVNIHIPIERSEERDL